MKTVLKTTFCNQNRIRFSFKNSPKGDQEVEPEHGRWDQRIDWLFFFDWLCAVCAVCGCEFISGGPSLVGFDPVTVLKNYYGQQLSDLEIWFTIHNMIWLYLIHVFNILFKKCLDKFCVFVNQVRSMVLEVFYNWRRCLWSQGRKVRENIFLVFQLTTFRCVFFLCFYERFEFRHP